MPSSLAQVRADFDRIAGAQGDRPARSAYTGWVLSQAPARAGRVLDIGCGAGDLCAALSPRSEYVLGVDLSPGMLAAARRKYGGRSNIEFRLGDILEIDLPASGFDLIVSMAALHHVPLRPALARIVRWLEPGGMLLIVDLRRSIGFTNRALEAILDAVLQIGRPGALRALWREHGARDRYLSVREVAEACGDVLPGARIRWRLRWRYSVQWTKPLHGVRVSTGPRRPGNPTGR